jgi:hypothetical protein
LFNIPDLTEVQKLVRYGFVVDCFRFTNNKIVPAWTADYLLSEGFAPKGTQVAFTGWNSTLSNSVLAQNVAVGDILTVTQCKVEGWNSFYEFEEICGWHHVTLFERWVQQSS